MVLPMDAVPGVAVTDFLEPATVCLVSLKNASSLSVSEALSELGVRRGRMLEVSLAVDRMRTLGVDEVELVGRPGSERGAEGCFFLGMEIDGVFSFFLAAEVDGWH